jgi:hypothetical protein
MALKSYLKEFKYDLECEGPQKEDSRDDQARRHTWNQPFYSEHLNGQLCGKKGVA